MKKLINTLTLASLIFMLAATNTSAQDEVPKKRDKITIKLGTDGLDVNKGERALIGKAVKKSKGKTNTSSLVMDIGVCNILDNNIYPYMNVLPYDQLKTKSINFNITKMYGISLYKKHVYLTTGLGFNNNNYRHLSNIQFASKDSVSQPSLLNYSLQSIAIGTLKKSKTAANYLTVPLMLQFKLGEGKKKFVIGGGVSAGYLVKGWQKAKYTNNKTKDNISYAFNQFALNAIGEIGIDNRIRFYGSYGLMPIYKEPLQGKSLNFGLRFMGL